MGKIFLALILCITTLFSKTEEDYKKYIIDIEQRFQKAYESYEKGDFESAKKGFQMAYFQVFENLEGPIRINVSARKSYELEATFVDLRNKVIKRLPKELLKKEMNDLVNELYTLLPELTTHTLVAESSATNTAIDEKLDEIVFDENWAEALNKIKSFFDEAYENYNPNDSYNDKSIELIQKAQFDAYRNSGLEAVIRRDISVKKEGSIQVLFPQLMDLIKEGPEPKELKAKLHDTLLLISQAALGLENENNNEKNIKKSKNYSPTIAQIKEKFETAFKYADNAEKEKAIMLIQDTYFDVFEASGMENDIGVLSIDLKLKIESYFAKLIAIIQDGSKTDRKVAYEELKNIFSEALVLLSPDKQSSSFEIFILSLTIILREGTEAILIIAAIMAYIVKSGNKDKSNIIYSSVGVAVALSFVTAWIMELIFGKTSAQNRELLEGITMLVASGLLLYMSYWFYVNSKSKMWMQKLNENIQQTLSSGSIKALWLTVFLAVYREGAETVLFYKALQASSSSENYSYIWGGFIVGSFLLIAIYALIKTTALKLPIKPFFQITSALIFLMCFMFVGQGVMELIEAKIFIPTLISFMPTITTFGIYPYVQTLIPQLIVLILGAVGFLKAKT